MNNSFDLEDESPRRVSRVPLFNTRLDKNSKGITKSCSSITINKGKTSYTNRDYINQNCYQISEKYFKTRRDKVEEFI